MCYFLVFVSLLIKLWRSLLTLTNWPTVIYSGLVNRCVLQNVAIEYPGESTCSEFISCTATPKFLGEHLIKWPETESILLWEWIPFPLESGNQYLQYRDMTKKNTLLTDHLPVAARVLQNSHSENHLCCRLF